MAELGAEESRLLCVTADITDYGRVKEAVERGVAKFGKLDILVNNAGWDVAKPFLQTEPDLWDKIIAINLRGPLNLHKAALPHMIAAGGGKVVNIASDAGRVGSSGESVYSADRLLENDRAGMRTRQCQGQRRLSRPHGYRPAALLCRRRRIRPEDL